MLLGAGCKSEKAEKAAKSIADRGVPGATTLRGKGVMDEYHPLSLGCVGLYGDSKANYYLARKADLIVGCRRVDERVHDPMPGSGPFQARACPGG